MGYASLPPARRADGSRRRVLVPGCGRGYDVALFAAHGYDAYGLEISSHAVLAARKWLEKPGERLLEEFGVVDKEGKGKEGDWGIMSVLEGDYFERDWEKGVQGWDKDGGGFDVIYDNTVSSTCRTFAGRVDY